MSGAPRRVAATAACALLLAVAACSGSDSAEPTTTTTSSTQRFCNAVAALGRRLDAPMKSTADLHEVETRYQAVVEVTPARARTEVDALGPYMKLMAESKVANGGEAQGVADAVAAGEEYQQILARADAATTRVCGRPSGLGDAPATGTAAPFDLDTLKGAFTGKDAPSWRSDVTGFGMFRGAKDGTVVLSGPLPAGTEGEQVALAACRDVSGWIYARKGTSGWTVRVQRDTDPAPLVERVGRSARCHTVA